MANDTMKIIAILAIAWLIFGQGGQQVAPATPATPGAADINCNYAPTFQLRAQDKWDSGINRFSSSYKINGGATATFESGATAIAVNQNDVIDVLWASGNSTVYGQVDSYTVSACGLNLFPVAASKALIGNTSLTLECFDENNDLITGGTTGLNYTIGAGETADISCRIKLDAAEKGLPHGGVLIAEFNATQAFDETKFSITGTPIGDKVTLPGAYTVSNTANKAVAYMVNPIMTTGYQLFDVHLETKTSTTNPGDQDDITFYLASIDCYEDSEDGKFKCAVEDEDDSYTGTSVIATEVLEVD